MVLRMLPIVEEVRNSWITAENCIQIPALKDK